MTDKASGEPHQIKIGKSLRDTAEETLREDLHRHTRMGWAFAIGHMIALRNAAEKD